VTARYGKKKVLLVFALPTYVYTSPAGFCAGKGDKAMVQPTQPHSLSLEVLYLPPHAADDLG